MDRMTSEHRAVRFSLPLLVLAGATPIVILGLCLVVAWVLHGFACVHNTSELALANAVVTPIGPGDRCLVHGDELVADAQEDIEVYVLWTPEYLDVAETLFPNRRQTPVPGIRSPRTKQVWYCPSCRDAFETWSRQHLTTR